MSKLIFRKLSMNDLKICRSPFIERQKLRAYKFYFAMLKSLRNFFCNRFWKILASTLLFWRKYFIYTYYVLFWYFSAYLQYFLSNQILKLKTWISCGWRLFTIIQTIYLRVKKNIAITFPYLKWNGRIIVSTSILIILRNSNIVQ